MIERMMRGASDRARQRRAKLFRYYMKATPNWRVLDLGGQDGAELIRLGIPMESVTIADVDYVPLRRAMGLGYTVRLLAEDKPLPFEDDEFDLVVCNSVIEHVGSGNPEAQRRFADEVRRVGQRYWVQTPNKWFPIESHSWLPFVGYLRKGTRDRVYHWAYKLHWPKHTYGWHELLNEREMRLLFPEADMIYERWGGMVKSITAVKA